MAIAAPESAESLRHRGNDLYKAGHYHEAIDIYGQAHALAPDDAAVIRNLSAVHYEAGKYGAAVSWCDKALEEQPDTSKTQNLLFRKAKAQLYAAAYADAEETAQLIEESAQQRQIRERCTALIAFRGEHDAAALRDTILETLPRNKVAIVPQYTYFFTGTDTPASLVDSTLLRDAKFPISILFGGIGDGRHLFQTLADFHTLTENYEICAHTQLHCTVNDIHAPTIARLLVMIAILVEAGTLLDDPERLGESKLILCAYYVYLAPFMPEELYSILRRKLQEVIDMLENRREMPAFLVIPATFWAKILRVLLGWRDVVPVHHCTSSVREEMQLLGDVGLSAGWMKGVTAPPSYRKQANFYYRSGALTATVNGDIYPTEARSAFQQFDSEHRSVSFDFLKHVNRCWRINVTMFDPDGGDGPGEVYGNPFKCNRSPGFGASAGSNCRDDLYPMVEQFFTATARGISRLSCGIEIEVCLTDVTQFLEQLRHDLSAASTRSNGTHLEADMDIEQPADGLSMRSKQSFDRIHLSNIPDYIGGTLTAVTYAAPLLRDGPTSFMVYKSL